MSETLFPTGSCALKRPGRYDAEIIRAAAEKIAPECAEWDENNSSPADWVDDLIKCRSDWDDGYRLTKALEDHCHIYGDMTLAEILDGASSSLYEIHREAVKAWVEAAGITPTYQVGEVVRCKHGDGPINRVIAETAEYVVDTEGRGNGGYVIAAEDVQPARDSGSGPQSGGEAASPQRPLP